MKSRTSHNHSHSEEPATREAIQQRAYELYLKRGQKGGHELEDWLRAEQEIAEAQRQKISSPAS